MWWSLLWARGMTGRKAFKVYISTFIKENIQQNRQTQQHEYRKQGYAEYTVIAPATVGVPRTTFPHSDTFKRWTQYQRHCGEDTLLRCQGSQNPNHTQKSSDCNIFIKVFICQTEYVCMLQGFCRKGFWGSALAQWAGRKPVLAFASMATGAGCC